MAVLVEKATSDLLAGPDWGMNLEICDAINHNPSQSRDVVKAIKKRFGYKNSKVQLLALTVLETVMKNCGDLVHQTVAEKGLLQDMVKFVRKKGDKDVRNKVLTLLDSWQKAFGGPSAKYSQYYAVYDELQRSGVVFPEPTSADTIPMITRLEARETTRVSPMLTSPMGAHTTRMATETAQTTRSLTQLAYGLPGAFPRARLDEVLAASQNFVWSAKDLDGARRGLELLNEMLSALDPDDKEAVKDDVIIHLVEQCVTNQKIVRQLVNSTLDESLLCQGLALNEELQEVLDKHNAILSGSSIPAQVMPGSPRGLTLYDEEEDEGEEFSNLAHRSSSRRSRLAAHGQQNGSPSNSQHVVSSLSQEDTRGGRLSEGSGELFLEVGSPALSTGQQVEPPTPSSASEKSNNSHATPSYQSLSPTTMNNGSYKAYLHESYIGQLASNSADSSLLEDPDLWSHPQHGKQFKNPCHDTSSPFDVGNSASSVPLSPAMGSNLPPPPILYTERERFFEERRQMSRSPQAMLGSVVERRMNLLSTSQDEGLEGTALSQPSRAKETPPPEKQASSTDRLFEDLNDFRKASFKTASVRRGP